MTEFTSILRELCGAGARFLIVGGYATIAHGYTRATEDLDIWIEPTRDNARRVVAALERFGADTSQVTVEDIADPYTFFRIGAEGGRRIDIIGHAEGLEFHKAWRDRYTTEFLGLEVPRACRRFVV